MREDRAAYSTLKCYFESLVWLKPNLISTFVPPAKAGGNFNDAFNSEYGENSSITTGFSLWIQEIFKLALAKIVLVVGKLSGCIVLEHKPADGASCPPVCSNVQHYFGGLPLFLCTCYRWRILGCFCRFLSRLYHELYWI